MKQSLKSLVSPVKPAPESAPAPMRTAKASTRRGTRQVGGHFAPEVLMTLRLIAVEQDKLVQDVLAEALNMVFSRYGKPTRADVSTGRGRG